MKIAVILLIILGGLSLAAMTANVTTVILPDAAHGTIYNPMTGFAPNADDPDIVGENRLVYVCVTWRELEPEKGVFDFESMDELNHLNDWRAQGKNVVFRFVCDMPGSAKHMDIPDWLYQKTGGDGDWYDNDYGKGYAPNYSNPIFISEHRLAIQALGERYGGDGFFCFIELGSLGHWGEWHTLTLSPRSAIPPESVRNQYVEPYLEFFPKAMLLMRRPFAMAAEHSLGLYNDVTGDPSETADWLDWIANGGAYDQTGEPNALSPMQGFWMKSPVGGELTSGISPKELLQGSLQRTLKLVRDSHMTFLGPYCPVTEDSGVQYTSGVKALRDALGYRLRVSRVELRRSWFLSDDMIATMTWVNDGSAPIYVNWQTVLIVLDSNGNEVTRRLVDIDLRTVIDSHAVISRTTLPTPTLQTGTYQLALAVIDPKTGFPALSFAMEGMQPDYLCILGKFTK